MRFAQYPNPDNTELSPGDYYLSKPGILYILNNDHGFDPVDMDDLSHALSLCAVWCNPATTPRTYAPAPNATYGAF